MKAKQISFYGAADGLFLPGHMILPSEAAIAANTPQGFESFEGLVDHMSQRIDLATGQIVDFQPPEPAPTELATWSWDAVAKRWRAAPTLAAHKQRAAEPVLAALAALDAKVARPAGEIAEAMGLGLAVPAAAVQRLQSVNADKAVLRQQLAAIAAWTSAPA